ncbi:PilN domain-containing protein [Bradyrhizobium sp.]|uniref:PilN domain-containing protein n=1 Tax=Bradyrhizobium sp. TaxID=376 RepID=UPI003C6ECD7B
MSELKNLFETWIAAVAVAVHAVMERIVQRRRILFTEGDANSFTASLVSAKGASLPETSFRLLHGWPEPALDPQWLAALRGSRIDIVLRPDRVLFREVDFPRQAADFLDGMIRAQIDRLTPWTAGEAVFGMTPPSPVANERIAFTLAATSSQKIQPLLKLATDLGAASVAGLVEVPEAAQAVQPVKLFDRTLSSATGRITDVPRLLRLSLLGAAVAAVAVLAISAYVGSALDAEQQDLQHRIAQRRAALRISQPIGSAETLLAKRKQTSPSSVMVLEAISRALPDTTYVTELRVEADKMQVVGLTHDAPSLIRLLEQSPQFTRATFFAPTTRAPNDPGEQFHIEAHITPYFGSGS